MKVKILAENTCLNGFGCEHGLSMLIEYRGESYLIDTGASGLFFENAKKMGVELKTVKTAFLSHAHYDHSGGYREFFAENHTAKVYLQAASARKYYYKILGPLKKYIGIPEGILTEFADRFEYVNGYCNIAEGITILPHTTQGLSKRGEHAHMYYSDGKVTAVDDFSHEQTVVFEDEKGLVLFNSCSHGGVENIIEEVKQVFPNQRIHAFFGGFHMMGALGPDTCSYAEEEVKAVAEQLLSGSNAVFYSGHCTGTTAYAWLSEVMKERLLPLHSGAIIEI